MAKSPARIDDIVAELARRFKGATPEMINRVLTPYRFPITKIGSEVKRAKSHQYVEFEASIPSDVWSEIEKGSSGKVVPREFIQGKASWKELLKARVHTCRGGMLFGLREIRSRIPDLHERLAMRAGPATSR
jgi:hypothetical protein